LYHIKINKMKKEIKSTKVTFDKIELTKTIIYKLEDNDDVSFTPQFFTLVGLRWYVVDNLWDKWEDVMSQDEVQDFTKSEILENDEYLFTYLDSWNYKVSRVIVHCSK
jgi:hypothetical protein